MSAGKSPRSTVPSDPQQGQKIMISLSSFLQFRLKTKLAHRKFLPLVSRVNFRDKLSKYTLNIAHDLLEVHI